MKPTTGMTKPTIGMTVPTHGQEATTYDKLDSSHFTPYVVPYSAAQILTVSSLAALSTIVEESNSHSKSRWSNKQANLPIKPRASLFLWWLQPTSPHAHHSVHLPPVFMICSGGKTH